MTGGEIWLYAVAALALAGCGAMRDQQRDDVLENSSNAYNACVVQHPSVAAPCTAAAQSLKAALAGEALP